MRTAYLVVARGQILFRMVCGLLKSTCFGALAARCAGFPTMMYIGYDTGAGSAYVQVLSSMELGVLLSGVCGDGVVRWSSSAYDPFVADVTEANRIQKFAV